MIAAWVVSLFDAQIARYAHDDSFLAVTSLNSGTVSLIDPSFRRQTAIAVGSQPMDMAVQEARRDAPVGTLIETCPAAASTVFEVAGRLAQQGGTALFIDYGHDVWRTGSSLQAVKAHQKVNPFDLVGEADLTAHVDFAALAAGRLDKAHFTENAQYYFTPETLGDYRDTLAKLGPPLSVEAPRPARLRGGFVNRVFRVKWKDTGLILSTYAEAGEHGRWEQFILMPE